MVRMAVFGAGIRPLHFQLCTLALATIQLLISMDLHSFQHVPMVWEGMKKNSLENNIVVSNVLSRLTCLIKHKQGEIE